MKTILKIIVIVLLCLVFSLAAKALACDTWVALANATAKGVVIFAKNSDRPLFDCQPLAFHPRAKWPAGAAIDTGRVTIPQVRETFATLGSSPFWCWGYEEGINEFGVAVGNEGVSTKPLMEAIARAAAGETPAFGPTGMDLVRLGLERGRTAREALEAIAGLVEEYGQFGSGAPTAGLEAAYDNTFLLADPREAWILETAGRLWAARRVRAGTASISNCLTLTSGLDLASARLTEEAHGKGWWPKDKSGEIDFASAYGDDSPPGEERKKAAQVRQARSSFLLREMSGRVDVVGMMRIARDRSSNPGIDLDQTASSCVVILPASGEDLPVFWWCASTPSRSCYVPFFVHGSGIPGILSAAGTAGRKTVAPEKAEKDGFREDSYWWLFRDLCDKVNADPAGRAPLVRSAFDTLEKEFADGLPDLIAQAAALRKSGRTGDAAGLLNAYTERCVARALDKVLDLRAGFAQAPAPAVPEKYLPYLGTYAATGPLQGREFRVLVRNGRLAVDIPGQAVVELEEPDSKGRWVLVLKKSLAFSFEAGQDGKAASLTLHQATTLPRVPSPQGAPEPSQAEDLAPFVGTYTLPAAGLEILLRIEAGRPVLDIKGQGTLPLNLPDAEGRWSFADGRETTFSFLHDKEGKVKALILHQNIRIPRKAGAGGSLFKAALEKM